MRRRNQALIGKFQVPNSRFEHVHLNIVGPLHRFSRWPEATPLPDQTASAVAHAFIQAWVSRFGVSRKITTDR